MRSRTSRGVPEWSGGEVLYMGSCHTVTGKVRGHIGIVRGPPEGFRGSTGRGHLSRRASWAVGGREPAPGVLVRPLGAPPTPRDGNPRGGGRPTCLVVYSTPLAAAPLGDCISQCRRPPGGLYKGRGGRGGRTYKPWRLPPPCNTSSSSRSCLAKPCRSSAASIITPSCCCWSLLPKPLLPPCWIKKEETSPVPYVR